MRPETNFWCQGPDSLWLNSGRCNLLPLDGAVYIFSSNLVMTNWLSIIFWFWHLFWHLGIFTILAFLASLTFGHYEIQKKTALKSKDAKIKATLVFIDVFFISRCQDAKNAKDAKRVKMPRCKKRCQKAKMPVPLKKMPTIPRCKKPEKPRWHQRYLTMLRLGTKDATRPRQSVPNSWS